MDSIRIPITQVPAIIEQSTGYAPNVKTVRRWTRTGYHGVKLRVAGFGRERFTTQEWLDQFSEACGPSHEPERSSFERPLPETVSRRRSDEAADEVLRDLGVIE